MDGNLTLLLPFYPKFPKNIMNRDNLRYYLIFKEYSTSNLIEWSDIIFHVGSSVQFEFFIKDKISVFPRYLMCNTLVSEKYYNAGLNLSNRDELRSFCNNVISSLEKIKKNYKKNYDISNKKFINDYVNSDSNSVEKNIEKIFLKIRKSI